MGSLLVPNPPGYSHGAETPWQHHRTGPASWEMRLVFQAQFLLTETLTVMSPLCVGLTRQHEFLILHLPCCQPAPLCLRSQHMPVYTAV